MYTRSVRPILVASAALVFMLALEHRGQGESETPTRTSQPDQAQQTVDYATQIQPILTAHCTGCHGTSEQQGGLRLDHRASAFLGGDSGKVIVPGESGKSELIRRILAEDESERMPPPDADKPLSKEQITLLKTWIDQRAIWPDDGQPAKVTSSHWAYQTRLKSPPPEVKSKNWVRNPIDQFVLARLEAENILPSPEADRVTLVKRLNYDLIGLPPTPEEVERFVADMSPDFYEKLVDQLLASPHFGERWGRHWLDKARYADSDGYEKDRPRPDAWRFRDWVINAINSDLPFDQFTIDQLAGDLLPNSSEDQRIATAFHRQTLTNTEGGVDKEEFRVVAVIDRANTTSSVWLGLTAGCAQCHTHKYDQITQAEYYQLFAFFNNGDETELERSLGPEAEANYQKQLAKHQEQLKSLETRLEELKQEKAKIQEVAVLQPAETTSTETKPPEIKPADTKPADTKPVEDQLVKLQAEIDALKKKTPQKPVEKIRVIAQRSESPRTTHILRRGDFLQPGHEVQPGTLAVLHEFKPRDQIKTADRLDLAMWLVSPENPLTSRVVVNHFWGHLFGRGIVRTMDDFGVKGEPPTHPELLDWLAEEFLRLGWSRKQLIRTIVLSSTYRQSSAHRSELVDIDPLNNLFARQNRFRVEGEVIRDLHLAASGLLSRKIGGPSVFPPMPEDIAALSYANNFKWKTSAGEDQYRRGMYTFFKRTAPHPDLMTFDCPDSNVSTIERRTSNTPLMALTTLNNQVYTQASVSLASLVLNKPELSDMERLALAFRRCLARSPNDAELQALLSLLKESRQWYSAHPEDAAKLIESKSVSTESPVTGPIETAAFATTVRVILNLDEFITRE